jgi:hypothetical protein
MLTFPMPTCTEVRRELEALALGELPLRDLTLVRLHLADCRTCAAASRNIRALVRDVERLRSEPAPSWRRFVLPAAVAASILVLVGLDFVPTEGRHVRSDGAQAASVTVTRLIAAQSPDGGWREHDVAGDSPIALGLSGLATLACLEASQNAPASTGAAERGSRYLARAVLQGALQAPAASTAVRLRAQAAVAWALREAAARWPDLRPAAAEARRTLAATCDATAVDAEPSLPDDWTALLVDRARVARHAADAGVVADACAHVTLGAALTADPARSSGVGVAPLTRLVGEVMASVGTPGCVR